MDIPTNPFEQAAELARQGAKKEAKELFTQVVAEEAQNYRAWLWLSELTDDLEEQTALLEKALAVLPAGVSLQEELSNLYGFTSLTAIALPPPVAAPHIAAAPRIEAAPATLQLPANPGEILQRVERLVLLGKRAEALAAVNQLTAAGSTDANVWLLHSELSPQLEQKLQSLEQVLRLDPGQASAAARLNALAAHRGHPLKAGQVLEALGEKEQAQELYQGLWAHPASAEEGAAAQRALTRLGGAPAEQKSPAALWGLARGLFSRKK
jgi:tetratricopeptide (TPR) repeat protein